MQFKKSHAASGRNQGTKTNSARVRKSLGRAARCAFEPLESRVLFSAGITGAAGAYSLTNSNGLETLDVTGSITLTSDLSSQYSNYQLTIENGGIVTLNSNQHVSGLKLNGTGTLDLTTEAVFINYGAAGNQSATDTAINGYIHSGSNGGLWTGAGIISSNAQGTTSYGVGFVDGNDNVMGASVGANTAELSFALDGDANLDGVVNGTDFSIESTSFGKSPGVNNWEHGDFYGMGTVNGTDFAAVNVNFGQQSLASPSGLTATATSPTSVQLSWTDNDSNATGYFVLRSTDGIHFTNIATINSAQANSYNDTSAHSGHLNQYKVVAFNSTQVSPDSSPAAVTTPLAAPSGLTASLSGLTMSLAWTDTDASATGYYVMRSTDGVHYTTLATLTSGSANSYTDSSVSNGFSYYYEVEGFNAQVTSAASNVAIYSIPALVQNSVSITTRYSDELIVTANGSADTITISENGSNFTIIADGQTYTDAVTSAGLFVYTRGGGDTINIANSVTSETTLETIDGAITHITSAGTDVTAWIDSTDVYGGTGFVNRVANFAGGVSKASGAALANPSDSGQMHTVSASLFGTGPVAGDVNQGNSGDCYFLASLAAFAGQNPQILVHSAVDMGDGTFVVAYQSAGTFTYIRVSNSFASGGFGGFQFAHPGTSGDLWAVVMEKAYAYYRTGANTYSSISEGWMGDVYSALGVNNSLFSPINSSTPMALYNLLSGELSAGDEVTFATPGAPANLVGNHAYTLVSCYISNGVPYFVVRNPWGFSGDSMENSTGYATLTYAQMEANFDYGCVSA